MKQYSTIDALYRSFYSVSLYRDVALNWRKTSFLYLMLLLAVSLIPAMFRVQADVAAYVNREAPKIIRQVPVITIKKGRVSVDAPMPCIIREPETHTPLLIIDTTGRWTSLDNTEAAALLTSSSLILRGNPAGYDLSDVDEFVVDQSRIYEWAERFLESFILFLYPIALVVSYVLRVIQALFLAVVGLFFCRSRNIPLGYPAVLSIAIIALTPAVVLNSIHSYLAVPVPFWWFLNFIIALGYLTFGVLANSPEGTAPGV